MNLILTTFVADTWVENPREVTQKYTQRFRQIGNYWVFFNSRLLNYK